MLFVCPRLQWRAVMRSEQQQFDVLELTGTVEEQLPYEPMVVEVYDEEASYLRLA
jgi:hypothetical protein